MSYLRDRSRRVITEAIDEGRRSGLKDGKLRAFVNTKFPFVYHDGLAAKTWFEELDRALPFRKVDQGQGTLFGG